MVVLFRTKFQIRNAIFRSSNHTYVNGARVGKGSAPRILRDGDVIGIVTNIENRKKTILGLVLREDRGKLENRKGTPGAARNTGAHLEPMQANSGKAEGRPTPVYNRKRPYGGEEGEWIEIFCAVRYP